MSRLGESYTQEHILPQEAIGTSPGRHLLPVGPGQEAGQAQCLGHIPVRTASQPLWQRQKRGLETTSGIRTEKRQMEVGWGVWGWGRWRLASSEPVAIQGFNLPGAQI